MYITLQALFALIYVVWGAYCLASFGEPFQVPGVQGFTVDKGLIGLFAGLLHLYVSWKTLKPTEKAVLTVFGWTVADAGPGGLVIEFWPFVKVIIFPATLIQFQIPGEPEKVDRSGDDKKSLGEGMVWPIRLTHAAPKTNDPKDAVHKGDPINRRMTTEWMVTISFEIKSAMLFVKAIGNVPEAKRQLRDLVEGTLTSEVAKRTPARCLAEWTDINKALKVAVETFVALWSIDLKLVQAIDMDLGHKVNSALRDVPTAEAERDATEIAGKAAANVEQFMLEAKAEGNAALAKKLGISQGEIVMMISFMQQALEKAQYSYVLGAEGFMPTVKNIMDRLNIRPN